MQNHRITGIKKWLLLTFLFTLAGSMACAQQNKFSLKDCIAYTLKNHPNSTIYRLNAEISVQKLKESKSAFLPSVNGSAGFDYNIKLQTSVIPAGSFSATETKLQLGNKLSTSAYLQADQTIYDKSTKLDIRSAKVDKEIADLNILKENESLIYNTAAAYYEALTYSEKEKLLRESEKQYKQLAEILKLRYEQGVVKKSEYDRSRVNLNNVQSELDLNNIDYQLALNKLKNAIGLDMNAGLVINDSVDFNNEVKAPVTTNLNLTEVVDYQIDQKNVLLKELDVAKRRAAFLPTVSAYAKYGANAYGAQLSNAFSSWFDYSTIGVKLNVPIFSGFKKASQLAQSRLQVESQRLSLKLNAQNYILDYQNSGAKVFNSYTSLKKNKENLALAKEVLDASTLEYREGTTTLSSLLDAEYSYKESRTNYITSLLDYLIAQIAIEKSKGTLSSYVNNLK
jgi:outer membrane protein TolC